MSKIMFRAPLGPPIDGVPHEAVLTEDEVDAICAAMDNDPEVVSELRKRSELVNKWRADPDPNWFVELPPVMSNIDTIILDLTKRPEARLLGVRVMNEFMRRKGWIE